MISEGKKFRPNVAAFVIDDRKKFLFCGRRDLNGFQLPQGGIEDNETKDQALARELKEETGITSFVILAKAPRSLKYQWDSKSKNPSSPFVGQEQFFYLVQINETEKSKLTISEEFIEFIWVDINHILENTVDFKKNVVREAWEMLKSYI